MTEFKTAHTGRLPGAFYWLFGFSLLVTGGPAVLFLFGEPHPVKLVIMLFLILTCLGMLWLMRHYQRSFSRLSYALTGDGIVINWGRQPVVIPYEEVIAVTPGQLKGAGRVYGFELGAYRQGVFSLYRLGRGQFYAIGNQVVFIQTKDNLYCITPLDQAGFVSALQAELGRRGISYTEELTKQQQARSGPWMDGWSLAGLVISLGLILGMALLIFWLIPRLPEQIPMHYNWQGQVDRYGHPAELYLMPGLALVSWLPVVIIGIAVAGNDQRIRRWLVAIAGGTVLLLWAILLAMVLPLL